MALEEVIQVPVVLAHNYVLLPNSDAVELKQPVLKLASILLGELVAIQQMLNFVMEENRKHDTDTVLIFLSVCSWNPATWLG